MLQYLGQNPKESLKSHKNKFSKDVNIQKSIAFLYVYSEQSKNEIKRTIPFTAALLRKKKYLGINITKEMQGLYTTQYC